MVVTIILLHSYFRENLEINRGAVFLFLSKYNRHLLRRFTFVPCLTKKATLYSIGQDVTGALQAGGRG